MAELLYRGVSFEEMLTGTPVQFVGVHPCLWHEHPEQPTMGFVEHEPDAQVTLDAALGVAVRDALLGHVSPFLQPMTGETVRDLYDCDGHETVKRDLYDAIAAALDQEATNG